MRIHRFHVGNEIELTHNFWLHDMRLINQWRRVLRMQPGQEVLLFDGVRSDRLYKILELTDNEAHLEYITDYERQTPKREVYLLFAMLKKDKNEWVLQKCTELGVSHFVPLITDRTEKMGFDEDRAQKIIIEAAEQCGRSDIPTVREPMHIKTALDEFTSKFPLFICEHGGEQPDLLALEKVGVLVGPEGGWSDAELETFKQYDLQHLHLGDFVLRAETATVSAATHLLR